MNEIPAATVPHMPSSAKSNWSSRRDFLTLAWKSLLGLSGMLGLAGLWRFLSYQPDPAPPTTFDLGLADQFPPNSKTLILPARAMLLHTAHGFAAFSLECPHLGCLVAEDEGGFGCPCHGSHFDRTGALERGPAGRPLRALTVEIRKDGRLVLITAESE